MTPLPQIIADIRAAMERATPGTWDNYEGTVGASVDGRHSWTPVCLVATDDYYPGEAMPNAAYIAACNPENIAAILDALDTLQAETQGLKARNERLEKLFEVQRRRSFEAGDLWRAAHPGNDLTSPDLGELLQWLMARADAAEARESKMREALKFYADAWCFTTHPKRPGLEWKPKEALLDDCGNVARAVLQETTHDN